MTYKAIKRLLIAVGLALLLTVVMMLLTPQSPTATSSPTDVAMICLIPLLFLGLLLTIFGLATLGDAELYRRSLDINVNLWTGLAMLAFGVFMLATSKLKPKKEE